MAEIETSLFFNYTRDAVFLLQGGEILEKNQAAEKLMDHYQVVIQRILEVAQGQGCILHATKEICLDCEIREQVDPRAFLFLLKRKDTGEEEQFSGCYSTVGDGMQSLSIRPVVESSRVRQILQKKQLVKYVTEAHEKERKMIAQELHDGIAQSIYSLMLELRQVKRLPTQQEMIEQLERMDGHFSEVLREIKQMAIDLRPTALDDLGLLPALKILLHRVEETTGMQVIFHADLPSELPLSEAAGTVIYRVVQEALMNCAKYAEVQEVVVWMMINNGQLEVGVLDQGKGFDLGRLDKTKQGLGLLNMQERAEMIGGHFAIDARPNEGTRIVLTIPIAKEEAINENHDS